MNSKMNIRYNRNSTPKLAKYDRRDIVTDVNISNQRDNMTNITITDHDLFDTEQKSKRDAKKKKRSNSEHKNMFYPLGSKNDNKFVYISPSR